jgi:hypothetical protein
MLRLNVNEMPLDEQRAEPMTVAEREEYHAERPRVATRLAFVEKD